MNSGSAGTDLRDGLRRAQRRLPTGARFEISDLKFEISEAGHDWVVDADRKSYFDTTSHDRLRALIKERVADGRVLALVERFLRAGMLEEADPMVPAEAYSLYFMRCSLLVDTIAP